MKAVGIVAEYNPLHNGHIYHMRKAIELSGCEAAVIAMSGNYVQRGAPAVLDKWKRTELALKGGADLVIEIPVLYCLSNAGMYSSAGVRLLESLGTVSHISFGSESGDVKELSSLAAFIRDNRSDIESRIKELSKTGMNYPAARMKACSELGAGAAALDILSSPNDILGLGYVSAMSSAEPVPVLRQGAGYHGNETDAEYLSAEGIRSMVMQRRDISGYVPDCVEGELAGMAGVIHDADRRLFDIIRHAVLTMAADTIDDCPSGGEGLGNLLKAAVMEAKSTDDLILRTKSRRYTYTRISRLLMQIVLGITRTEYPGCSPEYIRVLGFSDKGRSLLSDAGRGGLASLPVVTNINRDTKHLGRSALDSLALDVRSSDIYSVITGRDMAANSDHVRTPVYVHNQC